MKKIITIFLSALGLIASCSGKNSSEPITIPDYKKWKQPVNEIMDYDVPGHGSGFRRIFANDISYSAEISEDKNGLKKTVFPEGTYIIKESFKSIGDVGKKQPSVYGMIKKTASPQAVSGWIYFVKKPDDALKIVTTRMCVGCHESANEVHPYFDGNKSGPFRDYLFVPIAK